MVQELGGSMLQRCKKKNCLKLFKMVEQLMNYRWVRGLTQEEQNGGKDKKKGKERKGKGKKEGRSATGVDINKREKQLSLCMP